jgi:hypothetical protein
VSRIFVWFPWLGFVDLDFHKICDKVVIWTFTYMKFLFVQILCTCKFDFQPMLSY